MMETFEKYSLLLLHWATALQENLPTESLLLDIYNKRTSGK